MYDEVLTILKSIEKVKKHENNIPPTMLFNEGWLLRLVLNWFSNHRNINYKIKFNNSTKWYSEALLSTKFKPTYRGDKLAESWTHADGVLGDIIIGNNGFGDLDILDNCKQFIVIEAKIFSKYSKGTIHSSTFNQAARTVACMCSIISEHLQSSQIIKNIDNNIDNIDLAVYTFLPEKQITNEPTFNQYIKSIDTTVKERINQYSGRTDYQDKISWYNQYFTRIFPKIKIELISWEELINLIINIDTNYGKKLENFYNNCLIYNERE